MTESTTNEIVRANVMKQALIIRKDLNMRKGKMVSQGAHASGAAYIKPEQITEDPTTGELIVRVDPRAKEWLLGSFTKIVLSVDSEAALDELYRKAREKGLLTALIEDNGDTEFHGIKTKTALSIGPARASELDELTQELKLL